MPELGPLYTLLVSFVIEFFIVVQLLYMSVTGVQNSDSQLLKVMLNL